MHTCNLRCDNLMRRNALEVATTSAGMSPRIRFTKFCRVCVQISSAGLNPEHMVGKNGIVFEDASIEIIALLDQHGCACCPTKAQSALELVEAVR